MTTTQQPTISKIEARIDRTAREYYRQLSIVRIQDAVYAAGIPDETLEYFCQMFARETIGGQHRSELDNQIFRRVIFGARNAHSRTVAEFAQCWTKAIEICDAQQQYKEVQP